MSSFRPLTMICPCVMSCRDCGRLTAKPSRVTTLSSRRSKSDMSASPVFPGRRRRFLVILAELALEDSVVSLHFLLFAQPDRILARLAATKLMHARHAFSTVHGTLGRIAARPFQEQLGAFAATQSTDRPDITSHGEFRTLERVEL